VKNGNDEDFVVDFLIRNDVREPFDAKLMNVAIDDRIQPRHLSNEFERILYPPEEADAETVSGGSRTNRRRSRIPLWRPATAGAASLPEALQGLRSDLLPRNRRAGISAMSLQATIDFVLLSLRERRGVKIDVDGFPNRVGEFDAFVG
jgi:hypothetical protein